MDIEQTEETPLGMCLLDWSIDEKLKLWSNDKDIRDGELHERICGDDTVTIVVDRVIGTVGFFKNGK